MAMLQIIIIEKVTKEEDVSMELKIKPGSQEIQATLVFKRPNQIKCH